MWIKYIIISFSLIFMGCSLKPPIPKVQTQITSNASQFDLSSTWWRDFQDENLNHLVDRALKNGSDLELLRLKLEKAKQTLALQNANYMPTLSYGADISKSQTSGENPAHTPQMRVRNNAIRAFLSYEVDIWGRVKNSANAAKANFIATRYDFESAKVSYIANLTSTYFSLIALNQQKEILEKTIKNYAQTMDFRKIQFDEGAVNEVVYLQSKAEYQKAKIKLSRVENSIASTQSALSILTSDNLQDIVDKNFIVSKNLPEEPKIPNGISSRILLQRADVASAYKRIEGANFLVGVAKTAYYPTFSLTGSLGYQSDDLNRLFVSNASIWSLAGSLVGKIFDFGRTDAQVNLAKLDQNLSVINYEKVVKNALYEARNALQKRKSAKEVKTHLSSLINSLQRIDTLSNDMYQEGYTTHLELLDSQRTLLNTKVEYVGAKLEVMESIVDIYKAFGGGFKRIKE